jgi:hypothetical protein
MTSRALRWVVLCFATLWFNVLLPVHTRGQISLPGSGGRTAARTHACCPTKHASHSGDTPGHCPGSKAPSSGPCAVCFFMAGLFTPPPVTAVENPAGDAGEARVAEHRPPEIARFALPLNSRAPPAA